MVTLAGEGDDKPLGACGRRPRGAEMQGSPPRRGRRTAVSPRARQSPRPPCLLRRSAVPYGYQDARCDEVVPGLGEAHLAAPLMDLHSLRTGQPHHPEVSRPRVEQLGDLLLQLGLVLV